MSNPGFKPVCVLYQGNGSQFDGTCQLVCRHQILAEHFNKGDIVEVATTAFSGEEDPDENADRRRAIVMGDELVSSLLATLFHAEVPKQNDRKRKRSSEDTGDKVQDVLDEVLATVKDIKEEMTRQGQELSRIKDRQVKMESRISLLRETVLTDHVSANSGHSVDFLQEQKPVIVVTSQENAQENQTHASSPMISSVMSTANGAKGSVLTDSSPKPAEQSEQAEDGFEEVISFETDEPIDVTGDGWERYRSLPALILDRNEDYLKDVLSANESDQLLEIGTSRFRITIALGELEDILYKTNNAGSFAYRLAGRCFTSQEMVEGNTRGGRLRADGQVFKQLNPDIIEMITEEVKKRFPHSATDSVLNRCVKNAINERARNERKRMIRYPKASDNSGAQSPNSSK